MVLLVLYTTLRCYEAGHEVFLMEAHVFCILCRLDSRGVHADAWSETAGSEVMLPLPAVSYPHAAPRGVSRAPAGTGPGLG